MLFDYLFLNLSNFEYEINFIQNLWFSHFIDFCLLLTFEDISFLAVIFYILTVSILNLSFIIPRINWVSITITPIKIFIDLIVIYFFIKMVFLVYYFYVFIYFKELNESLSLILLIFCGCVFIIFMIYFPIIYFKFTNKKIYNKIFNSSIL